MHGRSSQRAPQQPRGACSAAPPPQPLPAHPLPLALISPLALVLALALALALARPRPRPRPRSLALALARTLALTLHSLASRRQVRSVLGSSISSTPSALTISAPSRRSTLDNRLSRGCLYPGKHLDWKGWHDQGDGNWMLGINVEQGRARDTPELRRRPGCVISSTTIRASIRR